MGPLGMVTACSWCGENWRHHDIGGVRCVMCGSSVGLCPPCWWDWRDRHPSRPRCCSNRKGEMLGQNLGGAERGREDELRKEVARLQSQLHDVVVECKKALNAARYGGSDNSATAEVHLCRALTLIEGAAT